MTSKAGKSLPAGRPQKSAKYNPTAKKGFSFGDDREKIKGVLDGILAFFHIKSREIPPEIKDLNDQMEYLFRPHGIMYRPVKLEKNWYKNASGAMLGKLKTGEAVALLPDKLGLYGFFDPTTQKRVRLGRKTQELLEEARKIVSSFDTGKKKAKGGRIVRILLYPLLFLIGAALGFVVSLCFFG